MSENRNSQTRIVDCSIIYRATGDTKYVWVTPQNVAEVTKALAQYCRESVGDTARGVLIAKPAKDTATAINSLSAEICRYLCLRAGLAVMVVQLQTDSTAELCAHASRLQFRYLCADDLPRVIFGYGAKDYMRGHLRPLETFMLYEEFLIAGELGVGPDELGSFDTLDSTLLISARNQYSSLAGAVGMLGTWQQLDEVIKYGYVEDQPDMTEALEQRMLSVKSGKQQPQTVADADFPPIFKMSD